ncbi:hypothetical protein P154DRAFT_547079 [Amniculicola lignicola CBS 123094]|uniref:SnoaL-like domain-containing protein n=1 Tax=Amniculicola lignicola CBS 123094 TaxID=1392246 RepID=A0A6A5WK26_9PLEO|nr:hypothetical protein P154DRAFT_547079 [Amniculicola lignicola CBS 123094]
MVPTSSNPHDYEAVRNVLSRYCESLDTKLYDLLDKVFLPDVEANYPFNPNIKGVAALRDAVNNRLGPIKTHHSLTTQTIIINPASQTANTVTYFIGAHLGQGPHQGKVLSAYGKYVDELVCLDPKEGDFEGVQGASGIWRIKRRTVLFSGRVGDEAIMKEF